MSKCDRASHNIKFFRRNAKLFLRSKRDNSKRFVNLEKIDVGNRHICTLQDKLYRCDRRSREQCRLLRMCGVADNHGQRRQATLLLISSDERLKQHR